MAGEVTFAATEADNIGAQRDWWRSLVFRRATAIRYAIFAGAAFGFFTLIGGFVEGWPFDPWLYVIWGAGGAIYAMLLLGLCLGLGYLLLPRRAARLYRQAKMSGKEGTFRWNDDGLSYVTANGTGQYGWLELDRWRLGRSAILFFITDNAFFYLPNRVLSDEQRRDLADTMQRSGLVRR